MLISNKNKFIVGAGTVFTIFLALFVIYTGPLTFPDSEGYLQMDIYRSIGYPGFLWINKLLFGSYQFQFVIFFQFIIVVGSALQFIRILKKTYLKDNFSLLIVFELVLVPVFYEFKLANTIMSEAIAYPLYLLSLSQLILGIFKKDLKYFYFGLLFLLALILVRGQFLFLVVVYLPTIILLFRKSILSKKVILLLVVTTLIPFLSIGIDVFFHSQKHNIAATTPWTGIQIATLPFFVADQEVENLFENTEEKEYFKFVFKKIKEKQLLLSQAPVDKEIMIFYFEKYTTICNGTINADGEMFFGNKKTQNEKTVANDKMSSRMMFPLIADNWQKYLKMYFRNIGFGFGTSKYFLVFCSLLIISIFKIWNNQNPFYWLIFIGSLCSIGNVLIVSLAEPSASRYVFYNNWVLITILLILIENSKFLKNEN